MKPDGVEAGDKPDSGKLLSSADKPLQIKSATVRKPAKPKKRAEVEVVKKKPVVGKAKKKSILALKRKTKP